MTYQETIDCLYDLADAEKVTFREKKFGIKSRNALGISHIELKVVAREIGLNNDLAVQLFDSGIYEGRLLCSKLFNPKDLTELLMEKWISTFENWEICDSFSMGLFAKSNLAIPKIDEWTKRKPEFQKRAGFATMAAFCLADKESDNAIFEAFFAIIKREAHDPRLYVKKAVNWALRSIGKRNVDLKESAIKVARKILTYESTAAKWIARAALKELEKEDVRISDYPRALYRIH